MKNINILVIKHDHRSESFEYFNFGASKYNKKTLLKWATAYFDNLEFRSWYKRNIINGNYEWIDLNDASLIKKKKMVLK